MLFFGTLVVAGLVALSRPVPPGSVIESHPGVAAEAFHAPDWDPVSATSTLGSR